MMAEAKQVICYLNNAISIFEWSDTELKEKNSPVICFYFQQNLYFVHMKIYPGCLHTSVNPSETPIFYFDLSEMEFHQSLYRILHFCAWNFVQTWIYLGRVICELGI